MYSGIGATATCNRSILPCQFEYSLFYSFLQCQNFFIALPHPSTVISTVKFQYKLNIPHLFPSFFYGKHVARSLEQVKVDLAYSENPVTILGVSGGIAYGALGATHHSLHDIAVLRTFPGMSVFIPADAQQTKILVRHLVDYKQAAYVRVGRAAVPEVYPETMTDFEIGKAIQLHDGDDLAIIACGEPVYHALEAAKKLAEEGINARVIDMSIAIKPCDREAVIKAARETGRIITVEEHSRFGGLGGMVAEIICEEVPGTELTILGIPDENAVHGTDKEIRHYYGLDAEGIYNTVKE